MPVLPPVNSKHILLALGLILALSSPVRLVAQDPGMQNSTVAHRYNFNDGWRFFRIDDPATPPAGDPSGPDFDDSKWEAVTLPHTARIEALVANNMWQGICWYRKHFTIAPAWSGKKIFIDFQGAMAMADIYVNGRKITTHYGGYLPFSIDLTDVAKAGDNVIAVQLDNRDNPLYPPGLDYKRIDFDWYGGLYRNVSLRVTDLLHITDPVSAGKPASGGIFITYPVATEVEATIKIDLHAANESPAEKNAMVHFELIDKDGKTVADGTSPSIKISDNGDAILEQQLKLAQPQLWAPSHPYLYRLRTTLLDGSQPVDRIETQIGIRRISFSASGGFQINGQRLYLRGANRHQEYAYLGYALSDDAQYRDAVKIKSAGFDFVRCSHYPPSPAFLDACDELGLTVMDAIPGWQHMGDDIFRQHSYENCQDMIRRDRNHPSVVLWETSLNETGMDAPFMEQMQKIAHTEYPGDQCFTAGWMDNFDVFLQARQHGGCHGYKNGDKACAISEYGDWEYFAGNPGLDQTAMKDLKGRDTNSRQSRADGERRLLIQAFNFAAAADDNPTTPAIGDGLWVMYDYSRGCDPSLENSGVMDNLRLPKFSYYFFQSQRNADEPPASPDVATGPMLSIASWWNQDSPTNVTVFSNCEEVELSLNGQTIARQKPDAALSHLKHAPFTFKIGAFTPGTLKAVGYLGGQARATDTVSTPGKAVGLRLRADLSGRPLTADGADAIFIYADAVDADGNVVHSFNQPVTFTVKGSAKLVGANPAPATAGTVGTILQAGPVPGSIKVEGMADGLPPADLQVISISPADHPL